MGRTAGPKALLGTASAAVALAAADTYVVVLCLQQMMEAVGLDLQHLEKGTPIISGFLLGYIAVLPLIGRLADIVDRRVILLLCLAVFVAGSAVTAAAPDMPVLVGGRVIQGIGGGGLVPATLALVADLWPVHQRGTPLGVVGGVQEFGSVVGPLLGAALLVVTDWRGIFWVNAALGLVIAGLLLLVGSRTRTRHRRARYTPRWLSALATLTALVGFGLLLVVLLQPERIVSDLTYGAPFVQYDNGVNSVLNCAAALWGALALLVAGLMMIRSWLPVVARVDLVGAVAIGTLLGCVVWTFASADPERRQVVSGAWPALLGVATVAAVVYAVRHHWARNPLIARGVLRGRVLPGLLVSFCVGVAIVTVVIDIPVLARLDTSVSQTDAALHLVRFLLAMPVGAFLGGWLLRWLGPGLVAGLGMALAGIALLDMSFWTRTSLQGWWSTLVLLAVGFGIGLAIAPVNDAALADAPSGAHGMTAALVVVARMTGMILGLSMLTGIGMSRLYGATADWQAAHPGEVAGEDVVTGFIENRMLGTMFLGAALVAFLAAAVSLLLGVRRRRAERLGDPGRGEEGPAEAELEDVPAPAGVLGAGELADAQAQPDAPVETPAAEVPSQRSQLAAHRDGEVVDTTEGRAPRHHDVQW